jgi:hypothetical protein
MTTVCERVRPATISEAVDHILVDEMKLDHELDLEDRIDTQLAVLDIAMGLEEVADSWAEQEETAEGKLCQVKQRMEEMVQLISAAALSIKQIVRLYREKHFEPSKHIEESISTTVEEMAGVGK